MNIMRATLDDLLFASENLSPDDLSDFNSMIAGRDPLDVFPKALDKTTHCIKLHNKVLAVGGHASGGIWFVTTNVITTLSKGERYRFYRTLKNYLAQIKRDAEHGTVFSNFVALGNKVHVRLLEALGATFQKGHINSPAGFPFKQFWL